MDGFTAAGDGKPSANGLRGVDTWGKSLKIDVISRVYRRLRNADAMQVNCAVCGINTRFAQTAQRSFTFSARNPLAMDHASANGLRALNVNGRW